RLASCPPSRCSSARLGNAGTSRARSRTPAWVLRRSGREARARARPTRSRTTSEATSPSRLVGTFVAHSSNISCRGHGAWRLVAAGSWGVRARHHVGQILAGIGDEPEDEGVLEPAGHAE